MMNGSFVGPQQSGGDNGRNAAVGTAIALLGALAAMRPESAVLKALSDVAPHLAQALPPVMTACGAVIAAFSAPPKLKR